MGLMRDAFGYFTRPVYWALLLPAAAPASILLLIGAMGPDVAFLHLTLASFISAWASDAWLRIQARRANGPPPNERVGGSGDAGDPADEPREALKW